ncbi:transcriptional regulator [Escherichia coli]|nr:transcriptional regulator [Escherichia coli]
MFLIITRDTMFFTAMKNILSKGNVVHITERRRDST